MTREFLLGEYKKPTVRSYIQSLEEILDSVKPNSQKNVRKIEIAKQHLREIRTQVRRLQEKVSILEEQVTLLQEGDNLKEDGEQRWVESVEPVGTFGICMRTVI